MSALRHVSDTPASAGDVPRRIAIFTQDMGSGPQGNLAPDLAKGFIQAGAERVFLLYLRTGPRLIPVEGVTAVGLGVNRSALAPLPLARVIRRLAPDLLISMPSLPSLAAVVAWRLSGRVGKFVASEHGVMSHESWTEHRHDIRLRLLPYLARALYPQASGIHAVSRGVMEDLLRVLRVQANPQRMAVIPNPVDIDRVRRMAMEDPHHPWLVPHRQIPVAIAIGRLAPQKNHALLIDAAYRVFQQRPFRLLILGEGGEQARLQKRVESLGLKGDVEIPGRYEPNPYGYLSRADLCVVPSNEEAFGLVVVEALACGTPVVATDCTGPRDILGAGAGFLVPRGDADAMAAAIIRVLDDPELRNRLRVSGERRANDYNPERVARAWLSFASAIP